MKMEVTKISVLWTTQARPGQQQCDPNLYLHWRLLLGCRDNNLRVIATSFGNLSTSRSRSSSSRVGSQDTSHLTWHSRDTVTCVTHSSHPHTRKHSVTRSHEPARDPARKVPPLHLPAFKDSIKQRSPTSYHQLMTAACSCNRQPPPPPSPAQLNNVHIKAGLPPAAPCWGFVLFIDRWRRCCRAPELLLLRFIINFVINFILLPPSPGAWCLAAMLRHSPGWT